MTSLLDNEQDLDVVQDQQDREWAARQAELAQQAADKPRREALERQVTERLAQNKMLSVVPGKEHYDYALAQEKGYAGMPTPDGEVVLPNEGYQPGARILGGRDLATGEVMAPTDSEVRYRATRRGRRRVLDDRREKAMTWLEEIGQGFVEGGDYEGWRGVAWSTLRALADGFYIYADSVNKTAEFLTGGYFEAPDVPRIPNMGTWEGMGASLVGFGGLYATAGGALPAGARGLPLITQETIKDAVATFAMNPDEGSLMTLLRDTLGIEGVEYLDPEILMAEDAELQARLATVLTDSLALAGATSTAVLAGRELLKGARGAMEWLRTNELVLDLAHTKMADELIEAGRQDLRKGLSTFNAGVSLQQAEGLGKEAAGHMVSLASDVAARINRTTNGLVKAAKGHLLQQMTEDEFVREYADTAPEEIIRSSYRKAKDQYRKALGEAQRKSIGMTKPQYTISAMSELERPTDFEAIPKGKPGYPGFGPKAQVAKYLEAKTRAALGGNVLNEFTPKNKRTIARQLAKEALVELRNHGNAVEWYKSTLEQAHNIVVEVHPEIAEDQTSRTLFNISLAVTSNGQTVADNAKYALRQYEAFKKKGRFPEVGWGKEEAAMRESFALTNRLIDEIGVDDFQRLLHTDFTVTELKAMGFDVTGELADATLPGSLIFGPKIGGGFFTNLQGRWDLPTFDRWWMRTWGRVTGSLIDYPQELREKHLAGWRQAIEDNPKLAEEYGVSSDMSDDQLIVKALEVFKDWSKTWRDKDNPFFKITRAINSRAAEPADAPKGGAQRAFMRETVEEALRLLKAEGYDMEHADLQALLWFPEQRLWDRLGSKQRNKENDYAKAFRELTGRTGANAPASEAGAPLAFGAREKHQFLRNRVVETIRGEWAPRPGGATSGAYTGRAAGRGGRVRFLTGNNRTLEAPVAAVHKPNQRVKNLLETAKVTSTEFMELQPGPESARLFHRAISLAKKHNRYGAAVHIYDEADYQGAKLFTTPDGKAGFAIKPDGDIVSVFSDPRSAKDRPASSLAMLQLALQMGGRKLDAFDTVLPTLYGANGMRPVARIAWDDEFAPEGWDKKVFAKFNNGEPDVVFMVYDPDYVFKPGDVKKAPLFASYEEAVDAQDAVVREIWGER